MPVISFVIVSWNVKEALAKNLERLLSISSPDQAEAIVVDNGSSDGTPNMMRTQFPDVSFIQNDSNRGFAHACNQGLKIAKGEILVLLNPDMLLGKGVIGHTIETLKNRPDIGVMGVKLLRPDGVVMSSVRR
ncbi:MAG: glycosyltransferase, partial [Candidatus Uhrbacteria bacterium]|nr:glycosyltransferase [Candidatus Uhrbacteria bacterium]